MPAVDWVAYGLSNFVVGYDGDLKVVAGKEIESGGTVVIVAQSALHLEMVAPTA
jgi:hypothetical protein